MAKKTIVKMGRPGYKVTKIRDTNGQLGLLFAIEYPDLTSGIEPQHRFMSAFEQHIETANKGMQTMIV